MLAAPGKKNVPRSMAVFFASAESVGLVFSTGGSCCCSARVYGIGNAQVSLHPPGILAVDAPGPSTVKSLTSKTEGLSVDEKTSSMAGVTAPPAEASPVRRVGPAEPLLVPRRAGHVPIAGRLERRFGREPCPDRSRDAGPLAVGANRSRTVPDPLDPQRS